MWFFGDWVIGDWVIGDWFIGDWFIGDWLNWGFGDGGVLGQKSVSKPVRTHYELVNTRFNDQRRMTIDHIYLLCKTSAFITH